MRIFVISGGNSLLIQPVVASVVYAIECTVGIPSAEFITCSDAGRRTDGSVVGNTEVHLLVFRAPVQGGICSGVRMQEDTVLDLPPLGVNRNTADHHLVECIRRCTAFIGIPAFEYVSFLAFRQFWHIVLILVRNHSPLTY